ncbi:putative transcriptional regulator [Oenococcus oeni]|uniref:LytTR family DNA-binding domain-containing protein n=1 Tax=Oenococcus oeni TaxID=1247 RepID=UPI001077CE74|nr:LytTR family DNA-binding domain-containing protein [Oenococcus oeni]AVI93904.1 response regulator [Oenococcus oeni]SYW02172.1 putative transcriptional regulator [Oenococcus oeni]SYW03132.1 putative transcriptional regulator [Oenococcus oeni]SYW14345.1 putative transcriptional regulator [Oenococcus oeni]SYW18717.1 putative transcriptional regulator [Oenococcus oeni]
MKISFLSNNKLSENEVIVQVTAHDYSDNVNQLIAYIEEYKHFDQIISINVGNAIKFINQDSLVAIEVYGDELRFFSEKTAYTTRGRLYKTLEKLDRRFVQIARGTVININYLQSLEAGFSGNMTAIMKNDKKINVSRRYLINLKERLGL